MYNSGLAALQSHTVHLQTWKIGQTIQRGSTPEQLERFLPVLRDDPRGLLAIGITEPDMGSDYIIPYTSPQAGPRLTAVRDGDSWVLNGSLAATMKSRPM